MDQESPLLTHAEEISPPMKAYYANRRLMWRNLAMIMLLNLGWSLCFNVVAPLMQLRLSSLGMNSTELGWLYGCTSWVTGFLTMYFAWKSDHTVTRWGRRIPYLFISAPFVILSVIVFPLTSSLWILLTIWAIQAISRDAEGATIPLLNIDCMPRRMLARMGAPVTIMFGIVGFLALRYGLGLPGGLPYFIGAALVFATTFAGFAIHEPPVHAEGRQERFKPWSAMQVAFQDRRTILLVISAALVYSFLVVWGMWIYLYAQNTLHLDKSAIGHVMAWPALIGIIMAWPTAWVVDHLSPYKLAVGFWLFCGLLVVLLWHAHTPASLTLVVCAGGVIFPLYNAVDLMVYRHRHPNEVGSVTSSLSFVKFGLCAGLVQGLSGNLIQAFNNNYILGDVFGWLLLTLGLAGLFVYRFLMRDPTPVPVAPVLERVP